MNKNPRRFYVYLWLRQKDSKHGMRFSPYYVGKGARDRAFAKRRCGAKPPQDSSLIVFVQEGLTEQEAFKLEQYCIALYGRIDLGTGILRNLTDGGEGASGHRPSESVRRKMSLSHMGKPGKRGRKLTEETKRKMSQSHLGQTRSQEHRNRMSQGRLGMKFSEKHRNSMARARLMYLYELVDPNGEIYITDNMREFVKQYGLNQAAMGKVVNSKARHHKGWTGRILERLK
jgi:hypothetical protein